MPIFSNQFTSESRKREIGPAADSTDFILQNAGVPIANGTKRELANGLYFAMNGRGWPYVLCTRGCDWQMNGKPLVPNSFTFVDKNGSDHLKSDQQRYEFTFERQVINGQKYLMVRGRLLNI